MRAAGTRPGLRVSVVDVAAAVRASSVAEVVWVDPQGMPQVAPVIALTRGRHAVLALTFDRADLAHRLAAASRVVLLLREPRGTDRSFVPTAVLGTPHLEVDTTGWVYREELITQELRRYPPSRTLADSPLLCREHWWYLPRLVLSLSDAETLPAPAPRTDDQDHLLVTVGHGIPVVSTVRAQPAGPEVALTVCGGAPPEPGPAVLAAQDASFPDLERWAAWAWHGRLSAEAAPVLHVDRAPEPKAVGLPPVPGVFHRWRRQRDLERACLAGIAAHE